MTPQQERDTLAALSRRMVDPGRPWRRALVLLIGFVFVALLVFGAWLQLGGWLW